MLLIDVCLVNQVSVPGNECFYFLRIAVSFSLALRNKCMQFLQLPRQRRGREFQRREFCTIVAVFILTKRSFACLKLIL